MTTTTLSKKEVAAQLFAAAVSGPFDGRQAAADQLTALKKAAKVSWEKLGLVNDTAEQMQAALVEQPTESDKPKKLMPAGVHKLTGMPKCNNVKGKEWVNCTVVYRDEVGDKCHVDGKWEKNRGGFVYFYVGEQGYRADVMKFPVGSNDEQTVFAVDLTAK